MIRRFSILFPLLTLLSASCGATRVAPLHESVSSPLKAPPATDSTAVVNDIATQRLFVKATTALLSGETERAAESADELMRLAPDEPAVLSLASDIRNARGDLSSAVFFAREAFNRAPEEPYYASALAELLRRSGDMDGARTVLEQSLLHNTTDTGLRATLALLYSDLGDEQAAVAQYRALLEDAERPPAIRQEALRLASSLTDPGARADLLQVLHAADPMDAEVTLLLVDALLDLNRSEAARPPLEALLGRFPGHTRARAQLERLTRLEEDRPPSREPGAVAPPRPETPTAAPAGATPSLSEIPGLPLDRLLAVAQPLDGLSGLSEAPVDQSAVVGLAALRTGRTGWAAALLDRAVRRDARAVPAWRGLAEALFRLNRIDEGLDRCDDALLLFPGDGPLTVSRGLLLLEKNDADGAQAFLDDWIRAEEPHRDADDPALAAALAVQALAAQQKGDAAEADRLLARAERGGAGSASVLEILARVHASRPRGAARAAELLQKAAGLEPAGGRVVHRLAALHISTGDSDEAMRWASRAVDGGYAATETYLLLADLLRQDGNETEALRVLATARVRDPLHPGLPPSDTP